MVALDEDLDELICTRSNFQPYIDFMGQGTAQKRFDAIFGNRRGLPGKQIENRHSAFELDSNGDKA